MGLEMIDLSKRFEINRIEILMEWLEGQILGRDNQRFYALNDWFC